MYEIDRSIELGDKNIILNAIKNYKNLLSNEYIELAENVYQQLINETFEEMKI